MAIITTCTACNNQIRIEKYSTERIGDIEKVYFKCDSCGKEYVILYTDPEIRRLQAEIRQVDQFIKSLKPGTVEWSRQYKAATKKHKRLKKEIGEKITALRQKMEGWQQ